MAILGIVVAASLAFGIYRRSKSKVQLTGVNVFLPPPRVLETARAAAKVERDPPVRQLGASELSEQVRSMDWFQFEKLVGHTYRKLGHVVTRSGGANPDGGIDLIIEKDGHRAAVQCKQWKTWNVGVKAVREFLGALTDADIQSGVFITLRGYTSDAKQLAEKRGIKILNETEFTRMLESTDAVFDPEVLELLHDTRKFCPRCESELVVRVARKGRNPGREFWGCSTYPHCDFTLPFA